LNNFIWFFSRSVTFYLWTIPIIITLWPSCRAYKVKKVTFNDGKRSRDKQKIEAAKWGENVSSMSIIGDNESPSNSTYSKYNGSPLTSREPGNSERKPQLNYMNNYGNNPSVMMMNKNFKYYV
jgi:hypothetical protein